MRRRRILFVIPTLNKGGAERVLTDLVNTWVNDADIIIATFDNGIQPFFAMDERVKLIPLNTASGSFWIFTSVFNSIKRLITLPLIIKKNAPDIVVAFMDSSIVWTLLVKNFIKPPVIMSFHVVPSKAVLPFFLKPLRKYLYKKADAAVLITNDMAGFFGDIGIELPSLKKVIFNPLHQGIVSKDNYVRENVILSVGRLEQQKQFDVLIKIYNRLQPIDWKLWIVGEGSERSELEKLIQKLGLENKVVLWGVKKNVKEYYARAKIFTLTSAFEGFSLVLCEAMANGCAVISYDCKVGPSENINHGQNGLLIEDQNEEKFLEGLKVLINNPSQIEVLGKNGIKIAEKLDVHKIVFQWKQLVEEVIALKFKPESKETHTKIEI